jgi:prevent-host-death family protein
MKQIPVSKFKADCSAFIEQVRKTKRPIQITRHGKVIAEIRPLPSEKRANRLLQHAIFLFSEQKPIMLPQASVYAMFCSETMIPVSATTG